MKFMQVIHLPPKERAPDALGPQAENRINQTKNGFPQPLEHSPILHPRRTGLPAQKESDLTELGITHARAGSILAVARAITSRAVALDVVISIEEMLKKLKELPGIGDWTAHYFAIRVLGWPDAFPHSDLGILKALKIKSPRQALALAKGWRPWRAYATIHLWKMLENQSCDTTILT